MINPVLFFRVVVYTSYLDDEKRQVLQLYGQRSDEATVNHGNILCDLPVDMENPNLLVTGQTLFSVFDVTACFVRKSSGNPIGKLYRNLLVHVYLTLLALIRG